MRGSLCQLFFKEWRQIETELMFGIQHTLTDLNQGVLSEVKQSP